MAALLDPPRTDVRAARGAVAAVFFANGLGFASWSPRIPEIQADLGLGEAALGLALLGIAAGSLLAMPASGALSARFGSRPVTRAAFAGSCLVLPLPALATGRLTLTLALVAVGVFMGGLDVAMNAQGVAVERRMDRPILSGFHGTFSVGAGLGALLGGGAVAAGLPPSAHLALVGAALLAAVLPLSARLLPATAAGEGRPRPLAAAADGDAARLPVAGTTGEGGPRPLAAAADGDAARLPVAGTTGVGGPRPSGPVAADGDAPGARGRWVRPPAALLALGAIAFAGLLAEGSMIDWSALYLRDATGAAGGTAALGFAAFSVTMALGRFAGDRVIARVGSRAVLRGSAVVAALGLAGGLAAGTTAAAIAGFALLGVGLSTLVPVVFSAAEHAAPDRAAGSAGPAIAVVSTIGYLGFLAGPPLIGFVAEAVSLPLALGLVAALVATIPLLARRAAPAFARREEVAG